MNIHDAFPSKYLKASDLKGQHITVTIDRVEFESMDGKQKPIVYFKGKEKGLVLNKTNSNAIEGMTGTPETDEWAGVRVALFATKVEYQGKRVDAIRIEDAPNPKPGKPAPAPEPGSDDEPPF